MIRKITPDGIVSTFAGNTTPGAINAKGSAGSFNHPTGIAIDNNNIIYVADCFNYMIRKITPDATITTLAGSGVYGYSDGIGNTAKFALPLAVAMDKNDSLYVTDIGNNNIRKITTTGVVSTFISNSSGHSAQTGIAVDKSNNILVTDLWNYLVQQITPQKIITKLTAPDMSTTFNLPSAIAVDNSNNIYILSGNQIIKITNGVAVILFNATVNPTHSIVTQSLIIRITSLPNPNGIAVDNSGNIYIADSANNVIKKVSYQ